jgi:predicted alpha/beta superfamily hydrolase
MKLASSRSVLLVLAIIALSALAAAQDLAPPAPQKLTIHSNILNEDRTIWVRTPKNYDQNKNPLPVVYLMDGPDHINEIGGTIDFLVRNNRMPELIVVGIANTDRTRDLTPTHSDDKGRDGKVTNPTSGGGDRFLDFIQTELMPEIEKRYRTAPYRIFAGHSLGGLMVIHTLTSRTDMFQAYIAVSPSLWWDNQHTLHQAQDFFATHTELNKTLFFSMGSEDNSQVPMLASFEELEKSLTERAPKDFHWASAHYTDEDHGSTVLRAHYAGLRTVFSDWQAKREPNGTYVGGLDGLEKHYRELSQRYGYPIPVPENEINLLGYQLMGDKKLDQAIAVFQRNVELYPNSANVYDSLGEGYENQGKFGLATERVQKAIDLGTKNGDPNLNLYKEHLKKVMTEASADKSSGEKAAAKK